MWTQVHVRLLFSRKHTLTLLTRSSCSGDEATERWLHRSQTKTTTHGSQVHMWAWHCCCAERTTCRILPISAFRFSFPFQLSVSAFHFSFQFPPFPLAPITPTHYAVKCNLNWLPVPRNLNQRRSPARGNERASGDETSNGLRTSGSLGI